MTYGRKKFYNIGAWSVVGGHQGRHAADQPRRHQGHRRDNQENIPGTDVIKLFLPATTGVGGNQPI